MGKIREEELKRACIILGGGEILDYAAVKSLAGNERLVVCADGGYRHCARLGLTPGLIVGDFDSIGDIPENIPIVALPPDKDYTDTDLAVKEAVARGFRDILLSGMTGGRPDHTLANLQTMAGLSVSGVNAAMTDGITFYTAFTASVRESSIILPQKDGYYFSVFAFSGICKRVNIQGGKYPLSDYDLRFSEARAVSNEFAGKDVIISLDSGTLLIIATPKD